MKIKEKWQNMHNVALKSLIKPVLFVTIYSKVHFVNFS